MKCPLTRHTAFTLTSLLFMSHVVTSLVLISSPLYLVWVESLPRPLYSTCYTPYWAGAVILLLSLVAITVISTRGLSKLKVKILLSLSTVNLLVDVVGLVLARVVEKNVLLEEQEVLVEFVFENHLQHTIVLVEQICLTCYICGILLSLLTTEYVYCILLHGRCVQDAAILDYRHAIRDSKKHPLICSRDGKSGGISLQPVLTEPPAPLLHDTSPHYLRAKSPTHSQTNWVFRDRGGSASVQLTPRGGQAHRLTPGPASGPSHRLTPGPSSVVTPGGSYSLGQLKAWRRQTRRQGLISSVNSLNLPASTVGVQSCRATGVASGDSDEVDGAGTFIEHSDADSQSMEWSRGRSLHIRVHEEAPQSSHDLKSGAPKPVHGSYIRGATSLHKLFFPPDEDEEDVYFTPTEKLFDPEHESSSIGKSSVDLCEVKRKKTEKKAKGNSKRPVAPPTPPPLPSHLGFAPISTARRESDERFDKDLGQDFSLECMADRHETEMSRVEVSRREMMGEGEGGEEEEVEEIEIPTGAGTVQILRDRLENMGLFTKNIPSRHYYDEDAGDNAGYDMRAYF